MKGLGPVTVVVPAHDEAALLPRCLRTLLAGTVPGDVVVRVVANACSDDTADLARDFAARTGHSVEVLETPVASKTAALRLGLFPIASGVRVCSDADVRWGAGALACLVAELAVPEMLVGAPALRVDSERCGPVVRAFYRVWAASDYVGPGMVGSGVYALNAAAAERLGPVPEVTNDDGWVMRSTPALQRKTTAGTFTVDAPRSVVALVRRRARIHNGNRELDALGLPAVGRPSGPALVELVRGGDLSRRDVAAYLAVVVATRLLARWRHHQGRGLTWSTDSTTRQRRDQ